MARKTSLEQKMEMYLANDALGRENAALRAELAAAKNRALIAEKQDERSRHLVCLWKDDREAQSKALLAMTAERDALAAHVERLREAIEKAIARLEVDSEDAEYVDTCNHCGDGAIDNIDSEEWPFTERGDMLCRVCGGDRALCGYSSGGTNEIPVILKAAIATTPAQSLAAHDAALLERVKARLYALASKEADQPYGHEMNPRQWAATCLECAAEDVTAMQEEIQSEADRIEKEAE